MHGRLQLPLSASFRQALRDWLHQACVFSTAEAVGYWRSPSQESYCWSQVSSCASESTRGSSRSQ